MRPIKLAALSSVLFFGSGAAGAGEIGPWRGARPLAGGEYHSLGLKANGSIAAWGLDSDGQTNVPEPNADFVAVAAGSSHSLGLKASGNIAAWGLDTDGQTNVPEPNADFVAVAAGSSHSLGLKADGRIAAWGLNTDGQSNVPEPNAGFVAVAAGEYHSLGLKADGIIVAWGLNSDGQTNVPEPNADFVAVAAGEYHSLGLKADGSIVAWGLNSDGQTNVPSPNTSFVAIAGGGHHSMGLKADGSIVAWGLNSDGQTNVSIPNTNFVDISAGGYHSLGLKADGSIVAWGLNFDGQTNVPGSNGGFGQQSGVVPSRGLIGGGTTVVILGSALGSGVDVTNVTLCGEAATIVTQSAWRVVVQTGAAPMPTNGDVVVWSSALGNSVRTNGFTYFALPAVQTRPVTNINATSATGAGEVISDGGDPVVERGLCWGTNVDPTVSGLATNCGSGTGVFQGVVMTNLAPGILHRVRAWARNAGGVAYGDSIAFMTRYTVTSAAGLFGSINPAGVLELTEGSNVTFAIAPNTGCQIANVLVDGVSIGITNSYAFTNVTSNHTIRATFLPPPSMRIGAWRGAKPVAGGAGHSLALKSDGSITGFGRNSEGQASIPEPNVNYVAVAAGWYHSLGLKSDQSLIAWGNNESDQTSVPAPNANFAGIAAGAQHSLGLKTDGSIAAWGLNESGQTDVPAPNTNFVEVAAGAYHSLGLKADGSIAAWGYNSSGQTSLPAPNESFVAVAAGGYHSLGLKSDGSVVAWGLNTNGQANVPALNTNFVAVAAGGYHTLALRADGSIVAWGLNADGQTNVPAPNSNFVAIAAGVYHSLGLKADGSIVVWGRNYEGQATISGVNANFGQQAGVVPPVGPMAGGTIVTILGANLGNGTDVTNVTLCKVAATIITQAPWAVTVHTGAAPGPTNGNVVVYSTSCGSVTQTNAFTYSALPGVVTHHVTNISATSAIGAGEVIWDGGAAVNARGLAWGTNANPTVSDAVAVSGSGTGVFSQVSMSNLTAGILYHVRAWASNSWGVAYGESIPFRALFVVTAAAGPHGSISPRGIFEIAGGGKLDFTITPDSGCQTAKVLVDGFSIGSTNQFSFDNITTSHTIRASFSGIGAWPGASQVAGGGYHSLGMKTDGHIVGWGRNTESQTNVPAPNTHFVDVSAGFSHSLGVKADGSIVGWGLNTNGQTTVPLPNSNFVAVAAGWYHSLGLKTDGSIVAWGNNTASQTNTPCANTDFVDVAGGGYHSLGLKADGSIVAWGLSNDGQTTVPAPNANFVTVAGGAYHSLGLKAGGSIVAWGRNDYGQTNVPSPNANFVGVAAGAYHSLGLKADGSIVAWGRNDYGQTNVPSPNANFVGVAAGAYHSLGLKGDGSIVAWGRNGNLQTNVPAPNAAFGQTSGIFPPSGPMTGGTAVTILGVNLGSGADVTNVTLCGLPATIVSQTPRQVVVQTGPAPGPIVMGDAVLSSTAYGTVTKTNAFTYNSVLTVVTRGVAGITASNAVGAGEVLWEGEHPVISRGLCWGTSENPTVSNFVAVSGSSTGVFEAVAMMNLSAGIVYHVRAWASNSISLAYGEDLSFRTRHIISASASSYGAIVPDGVVEVTHGSNAVFAVLPAPDGSLTNVLVDGDSVGAVESYTFTNVTSSHTIHAEFSPKSAGTFTLEVSSPFGGTWPGTISTSPGTELSQFVTNSPVFGGAGTQYVCWAGTVAGNSYAPLSPTNVTLTLTNTALLTWQWKTQYNLTVSAEPNGSVTISNAWCDAGSETSVLAVANAGHHFAGWYGEVAALNTNANPVTVTMDRPRNLTAGFAIDTHTLTVTSEHGGADPGTLTTDHGTEIAQWITNSPALDGATQYICSAASVAGNSATQVSPTHVTLTLTNDATLAWQWTTNFWLATATNGGGTVDTASAWQAADALVAVTATPAAHWHFTGWSGDTNGCELAGNVITAAMTQARAVVAVFNIQMTTNGVPYWWLEQYGLTNYSNDAAADTDHDGMLTWQEWVAGCDPTNAESVFHFTGAGMVSGQGFVVRWPSVSNRFYALSRSTNLLAGAGDYTILPDASHMPATPTENSYTDSVQAVGPYFYRIDVSE